MHCHQSVMGQHAAIKQPIGSTLTVTSLAARRAVKRRSRNRVLALGWHRGGTGLALRWHWASAARTLETSPVPVPVLAAWKISGRSVTHRRVLSGTGVALGWHWGGTGLALGRHWPWTARTLETCPAPAPVLAAWKVNRRSKTNRVLALRWHWGGTEVALASNSMDPQNQPSASASPGRLEDQCENRHK